MSTSEAEMKHEYEFPIKWTIPHFLSLDLTTENDYKSPTFFTDDGTEWQIQICSNDEHKLSLDLLLVRSSTCHIPVTVNFGIMNADGMCTYPRMPAFNIFGTSFMPKNSYLNPSRLSADFIDRNILLENKKYLLPKGHLTVLCQVILLSSNNRSVGFINDMSKLFNDAEFSDIKLIVGNNEFFAHKVILAGRSPLFRELIRSNEAIRIVYVDVDAYVFERLLQFMYTGCAHYLHQSLAKELVILAHKYEMEDLEALCIEYLCRKLNVDNAVEMAMFAVQNKLNALKMKTIERITTEFLKKDADSIMMKLFSIIETENDDD